MRKTFIKKLFIYIIVCSLMVSVLLLVKRSGGEEMHATNTAVIKSTLSIPQNAVAQYVSADGDMQTICETLTEIKALSDKICEGIDADYDKLYAISCWISENIYYDYDAFNTSVTLETIDLRHVLETKRTVCMGYANLCAALCAAQNIDCRVVHGQAIPVGSFSDEEYYAEQHEWNIALLGDRTVWLDTLWDTTNSYRDGEYIDGEQKPKYFDMSDEDIAKNHRADRVELRDYFSLPE